MRAVGSWAGNLALAAAHPELPSDVAVLLVGCGAELLLWNQGGTKTVSVCAFLSGGAPGHTLILSLRLPLRFGSHTTSTDADAAPTATTITTCFGFTNTDANTPQPPPPSYYNVDGGGVYAEARVNPRGFTNTDGDAPKFPPPSYDYDNGGKSHAEAGKTTTCFGFTNTDGDAPEFPPPSYDYDNGGKYHVEAGKTARVGGIRVNSNPNLVTAAPPSGIATATVPPSGIAATIVPPSDIAAAIVLPSGIAAAGGVGGSEGGGGTGGGGAGGGGTTTCFADKVSTRHANAHALLNCCLLVAADAAGLATAARGAIGGLVRSGTWAVPDTVISILVGQHLNDETAMRAFISALAAAAAAAIDADNTAGESHLAPAGLRKALVASFAYKLLLHAQVRPLPARLAQCESTPRGGGRPRGANRTMTTYW